MAKRTHIMIHCADTPAGMNFTEKDIIRWHTDPAPPAGTGRGWSKPGYAGVWLIDGSFKIIMPFDADDDVERWEVSNGASGWNGLTTHFCYIGGAKNVDTRTGWQKVAMESTLKTLLMMWPDVKLIGHNQVNKEKYCPSFDVPKWAQSVGIADKNIDFNVYWK